MSDCCSSTPAGNPCACSASQRRFLVLPCAGGSNVGQISNAAAVELDKQGKAQIYCLIGVAAHIPGMVDAARNAPGVIAIDGCRVACARRALEHIGIPISQHLVVTDLGIEKNHVFAWSEEQIQTVLSALESPASR
ncbi:MAG: zinc-binding protein [Anaerolineae bacterium]|nr:zinc-binding protein [Anaerolineae bacterium]